MSDYDLKWDKLWDELLVESGDAAKWEARGEAKGRNEERQYLLDMLDQGLSVEEIKRQLAREQVAGNR